MMGLRGGSFPRAAVWRRQPVKVLFLIIWTYRKNKVWQIDFDFDFTAPQGGSRGAAPGF
ncbi:MAG: hypothetical protein HW380_553 [Magnetococcales bacterium]|nr:hypothetical protein [Magnetococcales bacterium]